MGAASSAQKMTLYILYYSQAFSTSCATLIGPICTSQGVFTCKSVVMMVGLAQTLLTVLFLCNLLPVTTSDEIPEEKWKYVRVRENAFMFWWLYGAQTSSPDERTSKPLIMWLQGGPGASGTGFGNFEELGPEDINGKKREYTWLKQANVLFVDNPVGTGFSYVTNNDAFTTNVTGSSI